MKRSPKRNLPSSWKSKTDPDVDASGQRTGNLISLPYSRALLFFAAPLFIMTVGFALRLYHLDSLSVWIDEANSVRIAHMGFADMVSALARDSSPPLYYLLLRFWMILFGEVPAAVRLLSVLFGTILVGYIFVVAYRFFSYRAGLVASLLMAVAPAQILHAQQCRMYTLLPLLALGAFHCLKMASDTESRTWLAGWAACMIGALYTHNYGWFLFPACFLILLFNGSLKRRPWQWFGAAATVGIAYLPWSPIFWQQLQVSAQNAWFEPIWNSLGPHGNLILTMDSFSGGRQSLSFTWEKPDAFRVARWFFFAAASVWSLVAVFHQGGDQNARRHMTDVLIFLLVPLFTVILLSAFFSPIHRYGRSDQLVFPAFVILTAVGADRLVRPLLCLGFTGLLILFSLANYPPATADASMRGDAEMAAKILALTDPDDAVLASSLTIGPLSYYARQAQIPLQIVTFPRDNLKQHAISDKAAWLSRPGALAEEAKAAMGEACRKTGPRGRLFVILGMEPFNQPLIDLLKQAHPSDMVLLPEIHTITITNRPVRILITVCP